MLNVADSGIMVQKIDATAPDQRELRNELLKIYRAATETTGVRYPLVFRVTGSRDDAKWEYVCTYEELHVRASTAKEGHARPRLAPAPHRCCPYHSSCLCEMYHSLGMSAKI